MIATPTADEIRNEALAECGYGRGAIWTDMFSETQWTVLEFLACRCAAAEAKLEAVRSYVEDHHDGTAYWTSEVLRLARGGK